MAQVLDLTAWLGAAQSPDASVRNAAEAQLASLKAEQYPSFLLSLATELASDSKPVDARRLAGLVLKNALDAKDDARKAAFAQQWKQLDPTVQSEVERLLLLALGCGVADVRSTAALAVAKVAAIELPARGWAGLIPSLLAGASAEAGRGPRSAALQALGYVCEELGRIEEDVLDPATVNAVLTQVVGAASESGAAQGLERDPELAGRPDAVAWAAADVRLAALAALDNALEFARANMENEAERSYILRVVCEGTLAGDSRVRQAAWECLVGVAAAHYDALPAYMPSLFELSKRAVEDVEEPVALQALEFWCTVCEEELDADEDEGRAAAAAAAAPAPSAPVRGHGFVPAFLPQLVPLLLAQLTKQEDGGGGDGDDGAWGRAVAAGTCLGLAASVAGDAVLPLVMPFVQAGIAARDGPESWRSREAATFALGSVLEGPDPATLALLVRDGLPFLLAALGDPDARVKNTTAWALGRAFEHVHGAAELDAALLDANTLPAAVSALAEATRDDAHVAEKACYALGQLAAGYGGPRGPAASSAFSPFFHGVVQCLLDAAFRAGGGLGAASAGGAAVPAPDAQHLQSQAFEAVNDVVRASADDALPLVAQLLGPVAGRLGETLREAGGAADAAAAGGQGRPDGSADRLDELQGLLCGVLAVLIQRLCGSEDGKRAVQQQSDGLVDALLGVFEPARRPSGSAVREEAMLALGALTYACGPAFSRHAPRVFPAVEAGLAAHADWQLCQASVGVLGDLCRALEAGALPYCDGVMVQLLRGLQGGDVHRALKPQILSAFGDVALAIGDAFEKYLPVVLQMLGSAGSLAAAPPSPSASEDDLEAEAALRSGILEAWAGLLNGLSRPVAARTLAAAAPVLLDVVARVASEAPPADEPAQARSAIALLGDVAAGLPGAGQLLASRPGVREYVAAGAQVPELADVARWAQGQIAKAAAGGA